ncbi:unnamed protein product [Adineta steineri]|uniref:Leucine-rich repeat-containing protein 71 n=1 Tax=Adineta steineri TaxID=433720 RepID=A0A818PAE5_9BILA|nr:unnamed protein product [Adineta steineri]
MPEKKKKKPTKKSTEVIEQNDKSLRRFLKLYNQYSADHNSVPCTEVVKSIRSLLEDAEGEVLKSLFLRPIPIKKPVDSEQTSISEPVAIPETHVRPIIRTLLACANNSVKDLCVWNICMDLLDCIELNNFLNQPTTGIQILTLNDCLIQPHPLSRLTMGIHIYGTLRVLNLDYNEFGDEGCLFLCSNLLENRGITRLSLTYCDIGPVCGTPLGQLLVQTAITEIYLDGNQLGCQGAHNLIKPLLVECEKALSDKRDKIRMEEDFKAQQAALRAQGLLPEPTEAELAAEKKKKKKKKKKKVTLEDIPPFGPTVNKIHLFDNEIDCLQSNSFPVVLETINAYARLIEISEDIEELDLSENVIGHVCGGIILEALKNRKESKLKKIMINVSEKIDQFVFADILKLSAKMKKKKKRGKKKKVKHYY